MQELAMWRCGVSTTETRVTGAQNSRAGILSVDEISHIAFFPLMRRPYKKHQLDGNV